LHSAILLNRRLLPSLSKETAMIEYRVKRVERFIVTRHEMSADGNTGSATRQIGNEYDSADTAFEVGYALARADAERLQLPPDSMEVIYPKHPREFSRPVAA
jgi:hypothetical protein